MSTIKIKTPGRLAKSWTSWTASRFYIGREDRKDQFKMLEKQTRRGLRPDEFAGILDASSRVMLVHQPSRR